MNKKVSLSLVALAVGSVLSPLAHADLNDILITEYYEGSGKNYEGDKAVEISNVGKEDYTFTNESLWHNSGKYTNQVKNAAGENVLKDVTVKAGSSIVVIRTDAPSKLVEAIPTAQRVYAGSKDEVNHSSLTMTGQASVFITTDGDKANIHDRVGKNSYPTNWEEDNYAHRRSSAMKTPSADENLDKLVPSYVEDDFSDLGKTTFVEPPIKVEDPCGTLGGEEMTIEEVQGTMAAGTISTSKYADNDKYYELTGVVTKVSKSRAGGFFLQQVEGLDDSFKLASKGIFVSTSRADDSIIGKKVCVYGKITEKLEGKEGLTTILPGGVVPEGAWSDQWSVSDDAVTAPTATPIIREKSDGSSFAATLERYEGMLVSLPEDLDPNDNGATAEKTDDVQSMRVTKPFGRDFDAGRNNLFLSYKRVNTQPNELHEAGSDAAKAQAEQNNDYRLVIETESNPYNGQIPYLPAFSDKDKNQTPEGYFRINDSISGMDGVLVHMGGNFRLIANNSQPNLKVVHNTDRVDEPEISMDAGDGKFAIKIASQNVLNFFNSPYGGAKNLQSDDNRGAQEKEDGKRGYERQRAKIMSALYAMDADVVGLMEIENNGFSDLGAIHDLVEALNEEHYGLEEASEFDKQGSASNRYAFVAIDSDGNAIIDEEDHVGGDAITTGIIYRPKKVTLLNSQVLTMPMQKAPTITHPDGSPVIVDAGTNDDGSAKDGDGGLAESGSNYQRDSIVAKFQVNGTGKTFSLAVNHFKSKGSTCWEDWQGWEKWEDFDPTSSRPKMQSNQDFQGNCENFRVAAAQRLGSQMDLIGGDRILLGDFNAYSKEDPVLLLTSNPNKKVLKSSAYTLVDGVPVSGTEGATYVQSFGYINAIEHQNEKERAAAIKAKKPVAEVPSWSYSYNDEVGSLDHILISPSLEEHLIDATDWHTNSSESSIYSYSNKYTDVNTRADDYDPESVDHKFYVSGPFRSSDHDPALMTLGYKYYEAGSETVKLPIYNGKVRVTYVVPVDMKVGDVAEISVSPLPQDNPQLVLPKVTITSENVKAKTLAFDVDGLGKGNFTFTMKVTRATASVSATTSATYSDVAKSEVSVTAEVIKPDSTSAPKKTAPSYDGTGGSGSGGSLGFLSVLGLFGLGLFRRKRA